MENTGGCVKFKTITEIRHSSARDTFIAGSDCLVLNSLWDWEPVERFKQVSNMVSLSFPVLHHTGMQVGKARRFCLYQTGAERVGGWGGTHFVLRSHVLCSAVQLRGCCARAGLRGGPDSAEVERSWPHQQHSCRLLLRQWGCHLRQRDGYRPSAGFVLIILQCDIVFQFLSHSLSLSASLRLSLSLSVSVSLCHSLSLCLCLCLCLCLSLSLSCLLYTSDAADER